MKIAQQTPEDLARIASYYSPAASPPVDANASIQSAFGPPPTAAPPTAPAAPTLPDPAQTLGVAPPPAAATPKPELPLGQALAYFAGLAPAPSGITGKAADDSRGTNHAPYPFAPKPAPGPGMGFGRGPATSEDPAMAASEATQKTKPGEVDFAGAGRIMGDIRKAEAAAKPVARAAGATDYGAGDARKKLYGTFDTEERALQDLATAERARSEAMAAGMAEIGADRVREAALRDARAQHERDIQDAYMEDTQSQLDAVRSKTIDPNRLYHDGGSKALALIGGVLGGLYQGLNHMASNPFVDQMNRNIDRDIALQERELARNSKAIDDRRYILADMRNVFKDDEMARLQAKNLYYEGIKEQLAAQAATYDSPAIQARADQATVLVNRQQAALRLDEAAKKAAQAAAGAAFARAEQWKEREFALKQEEAITHRISANKEAAGGAGHTLASRFVGTGRSGNDATGYLARSSEDAQKREEARIAAGRLLKNIDAVQAIRKEEGWLGRGTNTGGLNEFLYKPEWKTRLKAIYGEMVTDWGQAKGLKALSESDYKLAHGVIGEDFTGIGSATDERLDELRRRTQAALDAEDEGASGSRAVKHPDETVEPTGGINSMPNRRGTSGVDREAP